MNKSIPTPLAILIIVLVIVIIVGISFWLCPEEETIPLQDETADWQICSADSDCVVLGKDGDCNCGCFNKNYIDWQPGGACFCAAPTSCKCIDSKCEGVFGEDETADWQTYRNEVYGFEIKYPKDWELIEKVVGGVSFGRIYDIDILGPQELSLSEYVNKTIIPDDDPRLGKTISKENIFIAGIEAIKLEGEIFGSMTGPWQYGIDTFLFKNGKIYRLSYHSGVTKEEVSSNEIKIFNQMLSTFRFIEGNTLNCIDSDASIPDNEYVKGFVEFNGVRYWDKCYGILNHLQEYYCAWDGSNWRVSDFSCPKGCSDGACIR